MARKLPELKIIVHDDACHLRLMAEAGDLSTSIAKRLASEMSYVVDEYHSSGHIGKWCAEHCLPKLPINAALLNGFLTNICEIVNSEVSPLGHTIHHMGRWVAQLAIHECTDVLNIKSLQKVMAKRRAAAKRDARSADQAPPAESA